MDKPSENITEARQKLEQLLNCGNERVELAAAKELISLLGKDEENEDSDIQLEVVIRIVGD